MLAACVTPPPPPVVAPKKLEARDDIGIPRTALSTVVVTGNGLSLTSIGSDSHSGMSEIDV